MNSELIIRRAVRVIEGVTKCAASADDFISVRPRREVCGIKAEFLKRFPVMPVFGLCKLLQGRKNAVVKPRFGGPHKKGFSGNGTRKKKEEGEAAPEGAAGIKNNGTEHSPISTPPLLPLGWWAFNPGELLKSRVKKLTWGGSGFWIVPLQ